MLLAVDILWHFEQGVSGGSIPPPVAPGNVASPPLVTFVDPERSPGVLPLPPPDASALPPQDPMSVPPQGYYSAPPGKLLQVLAVI